MRPKRRRVHVPPPSRRQNCGATRAASWRHAQPASSHRRASSYPPRFDELPIGAVGDRRGVDAEGRDRDLVLRSFVVVGPGIVARADQEVAAGDEHVGREIGADRFVDGRGVGVTVGIGMGEVVHELDGGEQGLVVLVLVLHHHPVHEPAGEERVAGIERGRVEHARACGRAPRATYSRAPCGSRIGSDTRSRRGCLNAS